jgi:hypothetical protein
MRLSALPRPLGALGQRTERRIASVTMESSRARSSADSPGIALAGQLGQRLVERGGLQREVACLCAIGLAGRHRLPRLHTQGLLTRAHPQCKVRKPWRALELDLREIAESRHRRVEQGTEDPRPSLGEFAPELRLVPPNLGLYTQEFDYQRAVEKIGSCSAEVGDGVEDQRTGGIENRLVVIAVELPATEAVAARETTGSIGQFFWAAPGYAAKELIRLPL